MILSNGESNNKKYHAVGSSGLVRCRAQLEAVG